MSISLVSSVYIQRGFDITPLLWYVAACYNHGQKSWDKFAILALLHTRQTRIQLHLPNLTPQPPYIVENYNLQFSSDFQHCGGWRGKTVTHF